MRIISRQDDSEEVYFVCRDISKAMGKTICDLLNNRPEETVSIYEVVGDNYSVIANKLVKTIERI